METSREGAGPVGLAAAREAYLADVALALVSGSALSPLLADVVRRVGGLVPAERVSLYVVEPGRPPQVRLKLRTQWASERVPPLPDAATVFNIPFLPPSVAAGRSLVAEDAADHPELEPERPLMLVAQTRSLVVTPIVLDGRTGGLLLTSTVLDRHAWAPDEVAFVDEIARRLSGPIRQSLLVEQLERERERLRVLVDVTDAIHRSGTEQEVIERALDGLERRLGFHVGGLSLVSSDGAHLVPAGVFGVRPEHHDLLRRDLRTQGGGAAKVLETGEPLVVEDASVSGRFRALREAVGRPELRSVGLFPLRPGGKPLGLLGVACDGVARRFETEDLATLQSMADVVGEAVDRRRAAGEVERQAAESKALADASEALLTRTANRDVLLERILDALASRLGHSNSRLLLVNRARGILEEWGVRGAWTQDPRKRSLRLDGPGVTTAAARDGVAVNVPDVSRDPRYVPGWDACRSEAAVPLHLDGEVIGVFDVQSATPGAFDDADVRILTAFASRAAIALRLSELVAELEERTRVLLSVGRATRILNSRLNAPDVLAAMAEETSRAFPRAEGCVVYVADEEGRTLSIASTYGIGRATEEAHAGAPIEVDLLLCAGRAFRENRPVSLEVPGTDELVSGRSAEERARTRTQLGATEIRHLLAAPIRVGERRLGVIEVLASQSGAFFDTDAGTLALLAEPAAIALRNARLIEELQRSNRLKDDFLANLSHEVRTPLTGIVGWAEVLLDRKGEDEETRRSLTAILGQADTLSRMIADLIDLSRIENFGVEFQRARLRLPDVLAAALDAVGPSATKRRVSIDVALPPDLPALLGDGARLKQVFWNLLSNAVKFSPSGGRVRVGASWSRDEGVEVVVEDDGAGIDPSFQPHVFERFRQEESASSRRFGGLGIGLAIAKAVIEAHGGTIAVRSEGKGLGARFSVRLPAQRLAASSASVTRAPAPLRAALDGERPALVVIGEEEARREHLALVGESLGYEALALSPAPAPLQLALERIPTLVIVDAGDDTALALDVARRLDQLPEGASVARLAVAADVNGLHDRLRAAGYGAVVARPPRRATLEMGAAEARRKVASPPG